MSRIITTQLRHAYLSEAWIVFTRHDAVWKPLQTPYDWTFGPTKTATRNQFEKTVSRLTRSCPKTHRTWNGLTKGLLHPKVFRAHQSHHPPVLSCLTPHCWTALPLSTQISCLWFLRWRSASMSSQGQPITIAGVSHASCRYTFILPTMEFRALPSDGLLSSNPYVSTCPWARRAGYSDKLQYTSTSDLSFLECPKSTATNKRKVCNQLIHKITTIHIRLSGEGSGVQLLDEPEFSQLQTQHS